MSSHGHVAFKLEEAHQKLLKLAQALDDEGEPVPIAVSQVLEVLAQAQVVLHDLDNTRHIEKARQFNKVLLSDALEAATMLYQAVYDGKVLFSHDQRRIRDTLQEVEMTVSQMPHIIDLSDH